MPIHQKVKQVAHVAAHKAGHAEHWGFVGIAAADVTGAHAAIWIISVWLLITGLVACIVEIQGG